MGIVILGFAAIVLIGLGTVAYVQHFAEADERANRLLERKRAERRARRVVEASEYYILTGTRRRSGDS
jgi:hypothetical protein